MTHKQEAAFYTNAKEVVPLSARERILMIRLLDKVKKNPAYAEALGIKAVEPKLYSDKGASQ